MIAFKFDKGRVKVGKYSLTALALSEAIAAVVFAILSIILGIGAFRDFMTWWNWNSALLLYSSGQSGQATARVESCIKYRAEFIDPHLMLAKIRIDANDLPGAQDEFEKVLRLQPNNDAAHIGLGVVALRQWDSKKGQGEALLNQARSEFALAAGSPDSPIALGHVALRKGNLSEAEKAFADAVASPIPPSLDGAIDLYIGEATVSVLRQNWARAIESYEKVRFMAPYYERGHANIAHLTVRKMETMEVDRSKAQAFISEITAFSQTLQGYVVLAGQDDSRKHFKPALGQYLTAVACVLIRSDALDAASSRLEAARAVEPGNKLHAMNYAASVAELVRKDPSTWRDDQRFGALLELERCSNIALREYPDLGAREKAIIYHYISIRFTSRAEDGEGCVRNAELALEKLNDGGVADDHLKALILRAGAVGWYNRRVGEVNPEAKYKCVEEAAKWGKQSLELEMDPDFSAWVDKIKR